jgi:RecA-family ATPase
MSAEHFKETPNTAADSSPDSNITQFPNKDRRKLRGRLLADYVGKTINEGDTLLGDRYLCRGGGMFIVAPSGIGKSVFSIQTAIEWSAGRRSFGRYCQKLCTGSRRTLSS